MPEYLLPESLAYTAEHVWVRNEEGELLVGISDFAQSRLEEVVYVDMPAVGARVEADKEFGAVESMKSVSALFAPLSGTVTAVNAALENAPSLINQDCYGQGWIMRMRPESDAVGASLLTAAQYQELLSQHAQE